MKENIGYDMSMLAYLKECRKDTGNRDIWSFLGKRMKRDGLYLEIDTLSRFLKSLGIKSGDSVAVCLPNIPSAIVAVYAINQIGAIGNIIHPLVPPEGLKNILKEVGSKVLFMFDLFYEKHKRIINELGVTTVVCSIRDYIGSLKGFAVGAATYNKTKNIEYSSSLIGYKTAMKIGGDEEILDIGRGEDIAVYLHSGGTTGSPKTVMLSNRALNALADKTKAILGGEVGEEDSMLMAIPLFHGFGLGVCMHTTLSASGRMVMMPQFNAKSACKLLKKEKVTIIAGVPTMYEKMMNEKTFVGKHLNYLKHCYCGGDKLPYTTKAKFDEILKNAGNPIGLSEGYGLTEVVTVCAVNTDKDARIGSVGKGLEGVKFKIVSDDGEELKCDQVGEILISTKAVMSGYFNDPVTTEETMIKDENGDVWIRTGDIGYIDSDGYLYFKDRKKRLVKISGVNVFPKEIEELVEAMPEIRFAAALETEINEKPAIKLLVVMNKGYNFSQLIEESIRRRISQNLMKYSVPRIIEARESLPLTEIGKVDYKKLAIEEDNK